jgi:ATP-dependent DNA helicase RecG
VASVTVEVVRHRPPAHPRQPYRVETRDEAAALTLVFFHPRDDYLARALPVGARRLVSGTIERFGAELQMAHPEHIVAPDAQASLPRVEPVYPLTAGLTGKALARLLAAALERAPALDEWLDPHLRERERWPAWREALHRAHAPQDAADTAPDAPARVRLAYDELLADQLALAIVRRRMKAPKGRVFAGTGALAERALAHLGFQLTAPQRRAVDDIVRDLGSGSRMLRLLQGDVGSGKTVVALLAMLHVREGGAQAALMAPTEVLANQHYQTIAPVAMALGLEVALLTGRTRAGMRTEVLQGLARGRIPLVVGTHALIQEGVAFADLGLAVIDEQHRFGVHQRMALSDKGLRPHILVMTATPIPRTLMLTAYGDLDASQLTEKPPGRRPIDTRIVPLDRIADVIAAIGRALAEGAQAFWVCPLVEESEGVDIAAAEARANALRQALSPVLGEAFGGDAGPVAGPVAGQVVGVLHGRQKSEVRAATMRAFARGEIRLLVATTVIEVGIDVPGATLMVIEHAERFGLAQLHQLRGRIGRGDRPSTCLLVFAGPLTETARARLQVVRETEDGFRIAEEDLRLRGAGEVLGVRQSGLPAFRLADLAHHAGLLPTARDDAQMILARDPELASERGRALKTLLYLFERDAAVRYVRSG